MKSTAAFFDIDGTLYREGLITEVFKKFIKYEIIDPDRWYKEVKPEFEKWDTRKADYDNYLLKMADIFVEAISGLYKSQLEFIAKQVISQKGERVYTYTRDRIKWHKEQGHKIITISGSPLELVKQMANKYGFDDYKGTIYEVDKENMYTGEVIPMWDSVNKKKAIEYFTEKYDIDLSKSYAYGDTAGDFTMLKSVQHPVCVNPTKELLTEIIKDEFLKKNVKIMVERKDVIYKLTTDRIHIY